MASRRRLAERTVQRGTRSALKTEMKLVSDCGRFLDRVAAHLADNDAKVPWREVQVTLLARLAELCRVFSWSLECGYTVPAMALGASIHELGYLSAFIADRSDVAERWLKWDQIKTLPWRLKEVRAGAHRNAVGKDADSRDDYSYAMLSMAKHANPAITSRLPLSLTGEAHIIEAHPFLSPRATTRVRFTIVATLRSTIQALLLLCQRGHVPDAWKRDALALAEAFLRVEAGARSGTGG